MAAAAIPVLTKAAPWIASGIGSLLGKKTSGPSKQQNAAMTANTQAITGLQNAATPFLQRGGAMADQGMGYLNNAGQYYRQILGSRQAANAALAPETASVLDYYRGAEGKTQRTLRGGSRDYALAELDRQKVGQIAGMVPLARRDAAAQIGNLGGTALSAGAAYGGEGGNLLMGAGQLTGDMFRNATTLENQANQGGKAWGGAIFDIVKSLPMGGGKSKKLPMYPPVSPG